MRPRAGRRPEAHCRIRQCARVSFAPRFGLLHARSDGAGIGNADFITGPRMLWPDGTGPVAAPTIDTGGHPTERTPRRHVDM